MNGLCNRRLLAGIVVVFGALFGPFQVQKIEAQTTNVWFAGSGFWQTAAAWSVGVPTNTHALVLIRTTNAVPPTVTINSATPTANLTISNLILSAQFGTATALQLTNAPSSTLRILNSLAISNGCSLLVTNTTLQVDGLSGGNFTVEGSVTNLGGSVIVATNVSTTIGNSAPATFTAIRGTFLASNVAVATAVSSQGTLTLIDSTNSIFGNLQVGPNGTGTVWVTGGLLVVTNASGAGNSIIGNNGSGQLTVSNGTVLGNFLTVGLGNRGTLTLAGGTNAASADTTLGNSANSTGTVWVKSGLFQSAGTITVGRFGTGILTQSNGFVSATDLIVGSSGSGTLTMAGGTNSLSGNFTVGNSAAKTGTVFLSGGQFVATNDTTAIGFSGSGQMTISNGVFLANVMRLGTNATGRGTLTVAGGTNALIGPLTVGGLGTGTVWVTGGQLVVTNTPATVGTGSGFVVDGTVTVTNGSAIIVSNATTVVGNTGSGSLSVLAGSMSVSNLIVGRLAGSRGTVTFAGGTNRTGNATSIALGSGSTGAVWITGGLFNPTNGFVFVVGTIGAGQLTLSNGTFRSSLVTVGGTGGSVGTLTVAGGTWDGPGAVSVGDTFNALGSVWITGGTVVLTNNSFNNVIGNGGVGRMTVSNGLMSARQLNLGSGAGAGTLTVAGGTNTAYQGMTLGNFVCTATGIVVVAGGRLDVTNATGAAVLEVRSGSVILNTGTLTIDKLVITNACGHFVQTGGTLVYGTINISPNLDADADGIPNASDLAPFNPADAGNDNDGDGLTNLQEFQAGTDPTNSASSFRVTSIVRTNNDVRVTWMTGIGKTNALEKVAGGMGSFTNNFETWFVVTNTTGTTTNYLDVGVATNFPARYYRVRLVP